MQDNNLIDNMDDVDISLYDLLKKHANRGSWKMIGNSAYWGRDRIKPVSWCISIATIFMVVIPSSPYLTAV